MSSGGRLRGTFLSKTQCNLSRLSTLIFLLKQNATRRYFLPLGYLFLYGTGIIIWT
jgi:hypothetical protein